jgi:DNA processing protein
VAIVGTREPTEEALSFTRALAASVVRAGWAVWSGGARGIDAAAHEGAMKQGGRTVVVCPSGLDMPYPPEHRGMFERVVASGGTLLTEFAPRVRPQLWQFHRRNMLLAALTRATVVVQAGVVSGARSTASAARKLARPLFVVPHQPWDEHGRGCALELEGGARALATERVLLDLVGKLDLLREREHDHAREHDRAQATHAPRTLARTYAGESEEERRVFEALRETPTHVDDLCERTALSFATVAAALLTLTLQAVVVEAPAGFYRRAAL